MLDTRNMESFMSVRGHFDRARAEFDPIEVSGEFGEFAEPQGAMFLSGLEHSDITEIRITPDFEEADIVTKLLNIKNSKGVTLSWELFCR